MVAARTALLSALLAGLGGGAPAAGAQPSPAPPRDAGRAPEAPVGRGADGGRDPFVRSVVRDSPGPVEVRPAGVAGLAVDQAVLRGVVTTREGRLAVLEGPDAKSYVVRRSDRLYDVTVLEITADAVRFLRNEADPAERVVRKRLRDTESGR